MINVAIAVVLVVAALGVALVLRRRQQPEAPTQPSWSVPAQLDRSAFARPEAPWLVAVFSSATCRTCEGMVAKAKVLESPEVAVDDVEVGARRELHERYRIEAVPITVMADADGVVRASFVGPATATDLWAAMAEVREPGSTPHDPNRPHPT